MIKLMSSDLNMKDKLIVKEDVQMNDFKSVGLFVMILETRHIRLQKQL